MIRFLFLGATNSHRFVNLQDSGQETVRYMVEPEAEYSMAPSKSRSAKRRQECMGSPSEAM